MIVSNRRQYIFQPKFSLKPSKVVLFNEVSYYDDTSENMISCSGRKSSLMNNSSNEETPIALVRKFHNWHISKNAHKTIQEKIEWMYLLAKSKYVKTYSGKEIFNFKINFITLTLPSTQVHPTSEITGTCFNQFLTEIRQRTHMENYVWRLEFQQNGNVHYHIVTDMYVDYFLIQKIWNRIINKLGYVDTFQQKFSSMTFADYRKNSHFNDDITLQKLSGRYAKGVRENWTNPPTVDVKICSSNKAIAYYISKYFSKKGKELCKCNPLDNEENSFALRLWFCSRSLSKLKSICEYVGGASENWHQILLLASDTRNVILDYANCVFFELGKLANCLKEVLYPLFRNYAKSMQYSSA